MRQSGGVFFGVTLKFANSPPKLGGVPFARFSANGGVVPLGNHPVCAFQRWLRGIFFDGAATPPNLGGEFWDRPSEWLTTLFDCLDGKDLYWTHSGGFHVHKSLLCDSHTGGCRTRRPGFSHSCIQ